MPTVRDFYDAMDRFAPFASQLAWDNSGLLIGDRSADVRRVCVALDITKETAATAVWMGADLLISHHPVIFHPLKTIPAGQGVYTLVRHGIAAICSHTPLDCAPGGVNDVLAELLGLKKTEVLPTEDAPGLLRCGVLPTPTDAAGLAQRVKTALDATVRFVDGGRPIMRVAVCGGSGGDLFAAVAAAGMDALVTGEASYHECLDAAAAGLTLITAGHYETENPMMLRLTEHLRGAFPETEIVLIGQTPPIQTK